MNVVREIQRINEKELDLAPGSGSWHDQYKDSAYIFIGGLNYELTEGDVLSIFSQYGEIADIDMPRDKSTGKRRGFAFLMYEDQRSTVLAVDNLNGIDLVGRTLRVDHVQNYKQKELVDGKWIDRETERLNAMPQLIDDYDKRSQSEDAISNDSIDQEDPMREYLIEQKKRKKKHANETPEERKARKERKKAKKRSKEKQEIRRITDGEHSSSKEGHRDRIGSRKSRSRSPYAHYRRLDERDDSSQKSRLRSRSPRRRRDDSRDRGRHEGASRRYYG